MTIIDIPPGWTGIVVALIGLAGAIISIVVVQMVRLTRENRRLWTALQIVTSALVANGIDIPDGALKLIDQE